MYDMCPYEQIRIHDDAIMRMCNSCSSTDVNCRKYCESYQFHMAGIKRAKEIIKKESFYDQIS